MLRLMAVLLTALLCAGIAAAAPGDDAERLIEQGHWRRARALLEPRLAANPNDAVSARQLARVLQAFREHDAALAMAEKAVKLAPNDAAARFVLAESVGDAAQRANPLKQLGLAKRFRREAEAVIALDPKHVEARLDLIAFHMRAPGLAGGDKKKARALVEEVGKIAPAEAWRARARHAGETRDTTALAAIYREGATRNPDDYTARLTYANWLAAPWRGPAAEAEAHARAAIAIDPARVGGWTVLAVLQARAQAWDELERTLAEAGSKVPDDLSPWYQAGRIALTEHGDGVRAERCFRRYLEQPAEAAAVTHAAARWRLGLALEKQGKRAEALAEVRAANQLDPKFEPAKKDLKRLKG